MQADAVGAGRRPRQGHISRVSSEPGDVVPDPNERGPLVQQTVVSGRGIGRVLPGEQLVRKETERTQAIVGRDDDRARRLREPLAVVRGKIGRRCCESARMKPYDDGRRLRRGSAGHPDVQLQAVLRASRRSRPADRGAITWRHGRIDHRWRPRSVRLRRLPPQVSDRWRGKRNPQKSARGAQILSLDVSVRRLYQARILWVAMAFEPQDPAAHPIAMSAAIITLPRYTRNTSSFNLIAHT